MAPADADDFALLWYPTYVGLPNPGYATPQLEIVGSNPSAGTTALPYGAPMLLARGAGAYLVGTSGPPSPGVWSISAKRVPMSPSMPITPWGSDPANHPPDIVLSVLDETGAVVAMGGIPQRFVPPLSLVAAPDGKSIVVAWHEPTSVGGPTAVRLGRFDCAGGI